ncbi:hypothetical protein SSX86_005189 [Deinandra increscens subsp. villosa]|uniref:Cupin type-1 domain-containing protein n=1 Tax=Deinandra increscens subsp. villosa TaxID=3103831 RepID=A0AAP0DKN5_9ASTR
MFTTSLPIRVVLSAYFILSISLFFPHSTAALHGRVKGEQEGDNVPAAVPAKHGAVVTKDQRWTVVSNEFGEISAVKVSDGKDGFYDLHFITMEPNSLFIPAHLHSDMVFYVNSGSGTLSWVDLEEDNDKLKQVELRTGDVYRLRTGSFFYLQSNLDSDRRKFRINAIFSDSRDEIREGSSFGAYSSVGDLLLGFDDKVLQAALNVNQEVLDELRSAGRQSMIVHGVSKVPELFDVHYRNMRAFLGLIENGLIMEANKKSKKSKKEKAYNVLEAKHDFENCNGWSLVVTSKQLDVLTDSDFGIFMVNLTKGAMMGPHWNPRTAEIAVVLSGRGMVHVVCPSNVDEVECKNSRFRVEEGDVFVVPRYHPMAQISFNNGSFVFVGFTTTQRNNHPQYLVGSASVFQVLDRRVVAASLGVSNTTIDELLSAQSEGIILECTSCAEEEERLMEEEIERQKEEEARREEEARKKEEEEARKKEEEEKARREEEEARKREEEEARKREEEEEARREEEEAQKREEEEAQKREEEEARKREEEEEARREEEEEEAATRRRHEEEEAARQQEEDRRRRQEEEEAARRQEEEADMRRQEEEEASRQKRDHDQEASRRQQEEEAAARRQQEQEAASRREEAARRQQEQEAGRRHEEEEVAPWGGGGSQGEGEAASKKEDEMARREREAEAAASTGRETAGGESMTEIKNP